jgi:DNA primase
MSIPQTFLQDLLARTDVVEVVGRYVQLKKGGANYMGLCPFHGEKSPSFSVSPAKQFYHCFGCGANGNAISFLMEHAGMGFVEAVKDLAQQCGLQVPDDEVAPQDREQQRLARERQTSLTDLLALAAKAYQRQLKVSPRAVAYLKGRGLSGEVAKQFGLGYAPEGWRALASLLPDYSDDRLVESGLVIAKDEADGRYDRFRDRIMFPIRNVKGETIGFGGRVLDKGEPKYLNSPETPVFSKGHELYGLFEARTPIRTQGYALVTEGYMDVVALAQHGFGNAVATLGTACTADHVHKLFRFTESVVFSFDGDAAGRRAAVKAMVAALPHAQDTRNIRFLFLPTEHDPDSYIRDLGADAFAQRVREAMPLSQFLMQTAADGLDLTAPEGRAHFASNARPLWQTLPDGALKRQLLSELALRIQLSPTDLMDLWQGVPQRTPSAEFQKHSNKPNQEKREGRFFNKGAEGSGFRRRKTFGTDGERTPWRPPVIRPPMAARAELVARILLSHPDAWSQLTAEDHELLAELDSPVGALLGWLECQWNEHGTVPWAVQQLALASQPFAALANTLMDQALALHREDNTEATDDALRELRDVLTRMQVDRLSALENQAVTEAAHNPEALKQLRLWQERRKTLLQALQTKPPT